MWIYERAWYVSVSIAPFKMGRISGVVTAEVATTAAIP